MFTVGIFTTHIPYIALVVFYAFFFLFGVNATDAENVQESEKNISIELPVRQLIDVFTTQSNFHYLSDFDFSIHKTFSENVVRRKLVHQSWLQKLHWQHFLSNSLSNRPPPFLA